MQAARRTLMALLAAFLLIGSAPVAQADPHESDRAGHPVRILAYVLHPIGVVLDYLLFRPVHWVGHREPFKTLFGHHDH